MAKACAAAILLAWCGASGAAALDARIVVQQSPVAGFVYHEGADVFDRLRAGDRLDLVREPTNPHDVHAVRIEWRGHTLGYVPRRANPDLARQMDHGAQPRGVVTALSKSRNGRHRITYEITVPLAQ